MSARFTNICPPVPSHWAHKETATIYDTKTRTKIASVLSFPFRTRKEAHGLARHICDVLNAAEMAGLTFDFTKEQFAEAFKNAPDEPLSGPVYFQARWCFPYRKSERKSVTKTGREIPHTSRPDLDNLEKNLLDVLTRLRFWDDDASVFTKSTAKVWGPSPYLAIAIKTQAELFAEVANGQ